jgi:hypothetical protein
LSTQLPNQLEGLHLSNPQRPDVEEIYAFMTGNGPDRSGRFIDAIRQMPNKSDMLFPMQWLFPTTDESGFDSQCPVLGDDMLFILNDELVIKKSMHSNFQCVLDFMGLEKNGAEIVPGKDFNTQTTYWLSPGSFFYRSITRILCSIQLFGMEDEARAFARYLASIRNHPFLDHDTFSFWLGVMPHDVQKNLPAPQVFSRSTLPYQQPQYQPSSNLYNASAAAATPNSNNSPALPSSGLVPTIDLNAQMNNWDKCTGFYLEKVKDSDGRTLSQLWKMPNLDKLHDQRFMLWLFPTFQPDAKDQFAPVLKIEDFEQLRQNKEITEKVATSFLYVLQAFDLIYNHRTKAICKAPDFERRADSWVYLQSPCYLSLLRMMKSLRLFGLEEEAQAMGTFIKSLEKSKVSQALIDKCNEVLTLDFKQIK